MAEIATWICWGVVIAIWIAGAAYGARTSRGQRQQPGNGVLWRLASVAAAVFVYRLARPDLSRITDHAWWIEFPGLTLLIASTGFTIWARLKLGRMWSASPNMLRANHELRTDGPYAITRHPIYTGLLGMLLGTLLVNGLGVSLALLGVAAVFLVTRIPIEERLMSRTFPTSTLATANACLASSPASTGCADRTEGAVEVHAHRRIAPTRSMIRCSRASFERRSHRA